MKLYYSKNRMRVNLKRIAVWKTLLCAFLFVFGGFVFAQNIPVEVERILSEELEFDLLALQKLNLREQRFSSLTGLQHYYFDQQESGLPVFGGRLSVHLDTEGSLLFLNDERIKEVPASLEGVGLEVSDNEIVRLLNLWLSTMSITLEETNVYEQRIIWWPDKEWQIGYEYLLDVETELRHVVLALDGTVLHNRNLSTMCVHGVVSDGTPQNLNCNNPAAEHEHSEMALPSFTGQYNYFPAEAPSPTYGSRTLETGAALIDPAAAPYGWHDGDGNAATVEYAYTQGNHVYAYYAPIGTIAEPPPIAIIRDPITGAYLAGNVPFPLGNSLIFDYDRDLSDSNPLTYLEDAITNLFVWNNLAHDYLYPHGFDEGAGNFQALNFSSGSGGDEVFARAQDGSGINNATFSTPPDGSSPTMRMFLWDTNDDAEFRDACFDNVIILHEYGHGLSYRLVGGPGNVSCLSNFEQGGEGWSDFIGMILTLKDVDGSGGVDEFTLGEGIRSIGNYVLEQGAGGGGVRSRFYSTDMECPGTFCNDMTYDQLTQLQAPHGVGTLWASMLWDMCWALIDEYGFEPDLSQSSSTAGNIRALRIVIEALKMTACEPSFINMRDAIFAANQSLYGSADEELLWEVFARRGLGVGAQAGGTASFEIPTARIIKTVDKESALIGETLTYTLTVKNNTSQSLSQVVITDQISSNLSVSPGQISNGGTRIGNTITWPAISMSAGASVVRTFSGTITATEGTTATFQDPVEGLSTAFVPLGQWILDGGQTNPATGSTTAWFHPSLPLLSESSLLLNLEITAPHNQLVFYQWHDMEGGVDGGVVEIRNGGSWNELGGRIIEFPYNGFMYDALPTPIGVPIPFSPLSGRSGYTGYSGGWKRTVIDLSGYSGAQTIRFRYGADESTDTGSCDGPGGPCGGWYLDDFALMDIHSILNEACVSSAQGYGSCDDVGQVGTIYAEEGALPVEWLAIDARPQNDHILLEWKTLEDGNNRGFWVERQVANTGRFERLSWVPAAEGLANEAATYAYKDFDVQPGIEYYYRLRQEDFDGQWSYSPIVSAMLSDLPKLEWTLFPNPGDDLLQLQFVGEFSPGAQILIHDGVGRQYYQSVIEGNLLINTDLWPSACYYVTYLDGSRTERKKWVKVD